MVLARLDLILTSTCRPIRIVVSESVLARNGLLVIHALILRMEVEERLLLALVIAIVIAVHLVVEVILTLRLFGFLLDRAHVAAIFGATRLLVYRDVTDQFSEIETLATEPIFKLAEVFLAAIELHDELHHGLCQNLKEVYLSQEVHEIGKE